MAGLTNSRIDQLPPLSSSLKPYFPMAIRNMDSGVTEQINAGNFFPSTQTQNFEWIVDHTYSDNESVTYGGKLWQSTINGNLGITPGSNPTSSDPAPWVEIPKGSSGLSVWKAGGYLDDEVFVLIKIDGFTYISELQSETRPYISSDFNTEWIAGDWSINGPLQKVIEIDPEDLKTCGSVPIVFLTARREGVIQPIINASVRFVAGDDVFDFPSPLVIKPVGGTNNFYLNDLNSSTDFFRNYSRQGDTEIDNVDYVLTTEDGIDATQGDGILLLKIHYNIDDFNL